MRHNYHRNLKCSQTTFKWLLVIRRRRRCKNKTILGKTLCFLFCFMLWIVLCLHLVNKPHSSEIFLFSLKFCFHLEVSFVKTVLLELKLERKRLVNCVMCRNLCCWGLVYLRLSDRLDYSCYCARWWSRVNLRTVLVWLLVSCSTVELLESRSETLCCHLVLIKQVQKQQNMKKSHFIVLYSTL